MADTATRDQLQQERTSVVKDFEMATRDWVAGPPSNDELRTRRNEVAEKLKTGYWELDPYIRARCLLDRTGVIRKGGRIEFYPSKGADGPPKDGPDTAKEKVEAPPVAHGPDDLD